CLEELLQAAPARAEQVLLGHARAVEAERPGVGGVPAHLAVGLADLVAGRVSRHDEVRYLSVARARRDGDATRDLGAGVGDELLRAVDHPLAVLELGRGPDVAGVGAR